MPRATTILVAATAVSVVAAVLGGAATKRNLAGAAGWVEHTAEVKLAVAEAQFRLEELAPVPRGATFDRDHALEKLTASAHSICVLTSDNALQQERCNVLTPKIRDLATSETAVLELHGILRDMDAEEDRLMVARRATLDRAQGVSSWFFYLGTGLGTTFGSLLLWRLHVQTSARAEAEAELSREAALMLAVTDSMGDAVIAMRPNRQFILFNRAARRLLGAAFPDEYLPADWRPNIEAIWEDGTTMLPEDAPLARALKSEACDNVIYRLRQLDDPQNPGAWVSVSSRPVYANGVIVAGVVILHDITEVKRQSDTLRKLSSSDEMTGLHNRRGFLVAAKEQLARQASTRQRAALVFADLNQLKQINDELGHESGDAAICSLGEALKSTFRNAIIGRLGGDEFALLLPGVDEPAWPLEQSRLHDALMERNAAPGPYRLSVSTGVAFYDPDLNPSLEEMLDEADQKMYRSKRERRNLTMPVLRGPGTSDSTKLGTGSGSRPSRA